SSCSITNSGKQHPGIARCVGHRGNKEIAQQRRSTSGGVGEIAQRSSNRTQREGKCRCPSEGNEFQARASTKRTRPSEGVRKTDARSARTRSGILTRVARVAGKERERSARIARGDCPFERVRCCGRSVTCSGGKAKERHSGEIRCGEQSNNHA